MMAANISMTLGQLVQVSKNPGFLPLMTALDNFMIGETPGSEEPLIASVMQAFKQVQGSLPGGVSPPETPKQQDNPSAFTGHVLGSSSSTPNTSTADVTLHSPTLDCYASTESGDVSYVGAVMSDCEALHSPSASMPMIRMGLMNPNTVTQTTDLSAALDTGCNICVMSEKALYRDRSRLEKSGAQIRELKPFEVQMADARKATSSQMVVGVNIVLGDAYYKVNFLVAPSLTYEYMLGFGFHLIYDLQVLPHRKTVKVGVVEGTQLGVHAYRPYQQFPVQFISKQVPMACRLPEPKANSTTPVKNV
jgi:hypothetical protein